MFKPYASPALLASFFVALLMLNLSGCWVGEATSPLIQGLRRDIHSVLSPLIDYPKTITKHPDTNHLSTPPMLDDRLVEALALEEPMNNASIRPPMPGLSRIYAQNPRRTKAHVYNGTNGEKETPYWRSDQLIQGWWHAYAYYPSVNNTLKQLSDETAPISYEQWFTLLSETLPLGIQRQVPLEVLKEKNLQTRQAWVIKQHQGMVYDGLFNVNAEDSLTRGQQIMWAMQLTGYWDELSKSDADEPDYTEWWASPYAEPDARMNLALGWKQLNGWERRYLTMAYSLGMLDEVLESPPPKTVSGLSHWNLRWNEPISALEALRTLGWIKQQHDKLQ
jgi:hypothetical protein